MTWPGMRTRGWSGERLKTGRLAGGGMVKTSENPRKDFEGLLIHLPQYGEEGTQGSAVEQGLRQVGEAQLRITFFKTIKYTA